MKPRDLPLFRDKSASKMIREACTKHRISVDLLKRLLEVQRNFAGAGRQHGITPEFDACFSEFLEDGNGE